MGRNQATDTSGLEGAFFSSDGLEKGGNDADKARKEETPRVALKGAFTSIDNFFLDTKGKSHPTSGSCALVCYLEQGALWAGNAGDSRYTIHLSMCLCLLALAHLRFVLQLLVMSVSLFSLNFFVFLFISLCLHFFPLSICALHVSPRVSVVILQPYFALLFLCTSNSKDRLGANA